MESYSHRAAVELRLEKRGLVTGRLSVQFQDRQDHFGWEGNVEKEPLAPPSLSPLALKAKLLTSSAQWPAVL